MFSKLLDWLAGDGMDWMMEDPASMQEIATDDLIQQIFGHADKAALEKIAHQRGYDSLEDYLRYLIENDTKGDEG